MLGRSASATKPTPPARRDPRRKLLPPHRPERPRSQLRLQFSSSTKAVADRAPRTTLAPRRMPALSTRPILPGPQITESTRHSLAFQARICKCNHTRSNLQVEARFVRHPVCPPRPAPRTLQPTRCPPSSPGQRNVPSASDSLTTAHHHLTIGEAARCSAMAGVGRLQTGSFQAQSAKTGHPYRTSGPTTRPGGHPALPSSPLR